MKNNIFRKKAVSLTAAMAVIASVAVIPVPAMAFDAPAPDDGVAGEISNGGEWSIYASKIGKILADGGNIQDVTDTDGVVEVTKEKRSAVFQFDLAEKDKEDKVIKSAKLRLTPVVSNTNINNRVSIISNDFVDTNNGVAIADFKVARGGNNDLNKDANIAGMSEVTEYPAILKTWQSEVDITGDVIGAKDLITLHLAYSSGGNQKVEYATCNIAENGRLNSSLVPFLYNGAATDYSKWVYPQLVFTYTDENDYVTAYNDFVTVSNALKDGLITQTESVAIPQIDTSTVTLEEADNEGIVTISSDEIAYNSDYLGVARTANVRLTVKNGEASYSRVIPISVDAIEMYEINFDAAKEPLGEVSVSIGNETYKDGTAYAPAGSVVTVNAVANTGYSAEVSVKKASDNSEVSVSDNEFVMPAEGVNISVAHEKLSQYGTSRIAAMNSISIKDNGDLQSPDLVIGGNRITFVKFDLSGYSADAISRADIGFTLTKGTPSTVKAVFFVPNNDWTESNINKNFKLDGTDDTNISDFKYIGSDEQQTSVSLLNGTDHAALIVPDSSDASSAAEGILKDYYIASTGTQKTNSINISDAIADVIEKSQDGIATFMIYSPLNSNDMYSVNSAEKLEARPSLNITEEEAESRSYSISFDTNKNTVGEISVSVGADNYTDGLAYAKRGDVVEVNAGANTGYIADITVKKADNSEVEVADSKFVMPNEPVSVSVEYTKPDFGTTRIAATNSVSVQSNGGIQSPNLVIGANRVTFVKFDLSEYDADLISDANLSFTLTKDTTLNTKAVFNVPNNNWDESNINKNFKLDGTDDTTISNFKYTTAGGTQASVSLLDGTDHAALMIPDTNNASSAAEGILKGFYASSTGAQKTCTISITDALKEALKKSGDGIVSFMVYSAGSGNDTYSVNGAAKLSARPSLTITESAEFLSDDDLVTEIKTVGDLEKFAATVNGGNRYAGKTVTLDNDIDLSEVYNSESGKSWTPIGADTVGGLKTFSGTFEGQDHVISGLYIDEENKSVLGLFGDLSGTVKDLSVAGVINGSSAVGGIAASCDGSIINCHSNVDITARREAGGIVGTLAMDGVISESTNEGNVKITNKETYAGGIAGHNIDGLVKNCTNSGKIENGMDGFRNRLGGIVGFLDNGTIETCTNQGEVVSEAETASYIGDTTQNDVGGIVGFSSYGTVISCVNNGRVYNTVPYAGGVAGYLLRGSLRNCYYDMALNSELEIVGYNQEGEIIFDEDEVYTEAGVIIRATYNKDGSLLKAEVIGTVKANDKVEPINAGEDQKVFVWTSLKDIKPVATKRVPAAGL